MKIEYTYDSDGKRQYTIFASVEEKIHLEVAVNAYEWALRRGGNMHDHVLSLLCDMTTAFDNLVPSKEQQNG